MAKKKTNKIPLPILILICAVLLFAIYTSISILALAIWGCLLYTSDIPEGEKSQYDGYALRFAPLSENAVKESWSGRMKGGVSTKSTKFTLLGYIPVSYTHLFGFPLLKRDRYSYINKL